MKRIMTIGLTVAAVVVAISVREAHAQSNPWSVSFDLGSQAALSGDVHAGGAGTVLSLPTRPPPPDPLTRRPTEVLLQIARTL